MIAPSLPFDTSGFRFWRLDDARFAKSWDSGEGSFRVGGRWNAPGQRVVYAALDPSTAILEVAVHKGFRTLDTVRHVLTSARIANPSAVHIVMPSDIPNANWLTPGLSSAGQKAFGTDLLRRHAVIAIPSVVSRHSWNLIFQVPAGFVLDDIQQEPFALDPRLHPPS
ncbi:MAG: RES domain-containing protein [Pseudomonadota bacterium]|nr:RES domain-containing protein [Pseudomonadota bacterium]